MSDLALVAQAIQELAKAISIHGLTIADAIDDFRAGLSEDIGCHGNKTRLLDHAGQLDLVAKMTMADLTSGLQAIAEAISERKST
jgi:fructose-1,6-bisphosphatase